jgi:acyl-CoA reductase-like NAD-dependent aldehyde dehydrogenase
VKTFGLWINGAEAASAAGATFDVERGGFKESSIGREVGLQAYRAYTQT